MIKNWQNWKNIKINISFPKKASDFCIQILLQTYNIQKNSFYHSKGSLPIRKDIQIWVTLATGTLWLKQIILSGNAAINTTQWYNLQEDKKIVREGK